MQAEGPLVSSTPIKKGDPTHGDVTITHKHKALAGTSVKA